MTLTARNVAQPRRGEEAVNEVGVSHADRLGVIQRIHRKGADVDFGPLEWLSPQQNAYGFTFP